MKRISLYLDKKLVKKADAAQRKFGYSSRNEFFTAMIENFIANEMIKENSPILSEKLSKAVAELSEDNAKAISKGLFRYAVELEMITRIIAQITIKTPYTAYSFFIVSKISFTKLFDITFITTNLCY